MVPPLKFTKVLKNPGNLLVGNESTLGVRGVACQYGIDSTSMRFVCGRVLPATEAASEKFFANRFGPSMY
jgi:hypothetical protein